jgi:hypothetical protein
MYLLSTEHHGKTSLQTAEKKEGILIGSYFQIKKKVASNTRQALWFYFGGQERKLPFTRQILSRRSITKLPISEGIFDMT